MDDLPAMLTPGEIARMLHVNPKTVTAGHAKDAMRLSRQAAIDAVRAAT